MGVLVEINKRKMVRRVLAHSPRQEPTMGSLYIRNRPGHSYSRWIRKRGKRRIEKQSTCAPVSNSLSFVTNNSVKLILLVSTWSVEMKKMLTMTWNKSPAVDWTMNYSDIKEINSELTVLLSLLGSVDRVTNVFVIVGNDEVISIFPGLSFRLHFLLVVGPFQRHSLQERIS